MQNYIPLDRKKPRGMCSLAIDDCVQTQFSSQGECLVDFNLACRHQEVAALLDF